MSDDARRVLEMLAAGKVTVDDADQLLRALPTAAPEGDTAPVPARGETPAPRFLRINVHRPGTDAKRETDVNVRVPLAVIRSGMRLRALIPGLGDRINARLRERGIDFDLAKVDAENVEALLAEMGQLTIDIDEGGKQKQVRISCE